MFSGRVRVVTHSKGLSLSRGRFSWDRLLQGAYVSGGAVKPVVRNGM